VILGFKSCARQFVGQAFFSVACLVGDARSMILTASDNEDTKVNI
jgi:hypothetical protein